MWNQVVNTPDIAPLLSWQGLHILPGLNAVTGDEGSGKTRWLRRLCGLSPQGDGPAAPSDTWPGPQPSARATPTAIIPRPYSRRHLSARVAFA